MLGSQLVSLGAKPTDSDLPKIAGIAALLAAVPAAAGKIQCLEDHNPGLRPCLDAEVTDHANRSEGHWSENAFLAVDTP